MNFIYIILLSQLLLSFGNVYENTKDISNKITQFRTLIVSKIHAITDHNYRKHFETLYLKKFVDKALKECVEDVEHFLYEVTYSV